MKPIIIFLIITFFVVSCTYHSVNNEEKGNQPVDAVRTFIKKLGERDYKSAYKILQIDSTSYHLWKDLLAFSSPYEFAFGSITGTKINEIKEEYKSADSALVFVDAYFYDLTHGGYNPIVNLSLKKIKGDWKIILGNWYLSSWMPFTDKSNEPLFFLLDYKGKYPYQVDLFHNRIIEYRLRKLLGETRFNWLKDIWMMQTPIAIKDSIFFTSGNVRYGGHTDEQAIIIADIKKNVLYVEIANEGSRNIPEQRRFYHSKYFTENCQMIPQKIWTYFLDSHNPDEKIKEIDVLYK